jgi:hypothetical protein
MIFLYLFFPEAYNLTLHNFICSFHHVGNHHWQYLLSISSSSSMTFLPFPVTNNLVYHLTTISAPPPPHTMQESMFGNIYLHLFFYRDFYITKILSRGFLFVTFPVINNSVQHLTWVLPCFQCQQK